MLVTAFTSMLNGLGIGLLIYFSKASKTDTDTIFNPDKLLRIVVLSLVISLSALYAGYELTAMNWQNYIAANTGLVVVADQLTKMIWRLILRLWVEK